MREAISIPVCIIGAGPAGASVAHYLSKNNIQNVILDKQLFPRDKICGDALSGKVLDHLTELNPLWVNELKNKTDEYCITEGIRFFAPSYNKIDVPFPKREDKRPVGFVAKRLDFDNFLFQKLSPTFTCVYQNAQVESFKKLEKGYKINFKVGEKEYELSCKILIGADGANSIVAKNLQGRVIDDNSFSASVRAYYTGVTDLHPQNFLELHFIKGFMPGYLWVFPLPNGQANVGLGLLSKHVKSQKINLKTLLPQLIQEHPILSKRFANAKLSSKITGWGLPLGSKKRTIAGDDYMLVGDAAWLVDPFTGEGIGNAMLSGKIAAKYAMQSLKNNATENFSAYQQEIYKTLWSELQLSHKLQKLSSQPWLFNFLVNRAVKSPTMQDTLTCMFNDLEIRARLKKPSFYFSLIFN